MKYWWVNQNQTHKQEIEGGYMWSPKKKKNGAANRFYDNMKEVRPGDRVFSFYGTRIPYLGVITSHAYSQPKPDELGFVGNVWGLDGWMVNVEYHKIENEIKPRDHIKEIKPLLPQKYSPLQKNGNGIQGVYLTEIPDPLALKLLELIGVDSISGLPEGAGYDEERTRQEAEADRIEKRIKRNSNIPETEKEALIKARKGQGRFRQMVIAVHKQCPFTGVKNPEFLRAGHIKPWAKCSKNEDRLDPLNGLPLTPVADQLLDKGLISFDNEGRVLFSPNLDSNELRKMGIDPNGNYKIKIHGERQRDYIQYHRD